jgi:hypothetical protein
MTMIKLNEPILMTATELGWIRQPALDSVHIAVWKLPDGSMYAGQKTTLGTVIEPVMKILELEPFDAR